ncbi:D-alanyl-D-alanine dipeptidase [Bacteroidia bacterium]|nr:D-alanyl-D-alanine dipeptidase [Bacteroidia bacterium]
MGAWLGTTFYPEIAEYPDLDISGSTSAYASPLIPPSAGSTSLASALLDYPVPAYGTARNPKPLYKSTEELRLEKHGLVNLREYVPDVVVRSIYATYQNVLGVKLYDYNEAYLLPSAAIKLANAQEILRASNQHLGLVVYDAARPQHIQQKCWDFASLKGYKYLFTPPHQVSMHCYGVAVDVGLIDLTTYKELDMGCPIDMPGKLASIQYEDHLVLRGLLTNKQLYHRLLLRNVMRAAGFTPIANEWWHFDACSRVYAYENFKPIP